MNEEIKDLISKINSMKLDLKQMDYRLSSDTQVSYFEIEKINEYIKFLHEDNQSIKKENILLKEAIVSIANHVDFKSESIKKLTNEIIDNNFK